MLDPSTPSAAEIEASLLPCPFCGDKPELHHGRHGSWVSCTRCCVATRIRSVDEVTGAWDQRSDATITTLTARAEAAERARDHLTHKVLEASLERQQLADRIEAAEALLVVRQRDIDEQVRVNEAYNTECEELTARVATLEEALRRMVAVANEARDQWDIAPSHMKAGKLLIALSGKLPGYRADIDAIHAALAPKQEKSHD